MTKMSDKNKVNNKSIQDLKDLIKVQCSDGNWNYDEYMHGMANGMLVALSCFDGASPEFLDAPDVWLKDMKGDEKPEVSCGSNHDNQETLPSNNSGELD